MSTSATATPPAPSETATAATAQPLTRGHKKKERTRRRLISAAIDVIAARGEAFSISDIAERADVSNGTFYNYFDDRGDLVDAVVDEVITRFAAQSDAVVETDDPVDRFATVSSLALLGAAASPDHVSVVLRLDAVQRALVDGEASSFLRADIAAGHRAGRFTTGADQATVDIVVGSLLLASRRMAAATHDERYPIEVVSRLLCSLGISPTDADAIAATAIERAGATTSQS